jgi:hypothetical protein
MLKEFKIRIILKKVLNKHLHIDDSFAAEGLRDPLQSILSTIVINACANTLEGKIEYICV